MVFHILCVSLTFAFLFASVKGQCHNPRVRKEWRCLCSDERAAWINAVKCLTTLPHNPRIIPTVDPALSLIPPLNQNTSYFDDFTYVHMDLNVKIHNTGFFLPWHRMYVQTLEDEMRSKCGYDGVQPYWDWTQDAADFTHTTILSGSTFDGLGTWGDPNNDFQLYDGGFKDVRAAYPVPHGIRRNYTNQPFLGGVFPAPTGAPPVDPLLMINTTFTIEVVNSVVNNHTGDYVGFQANLEGLAGPHPGPHFILGGDNGGTCPFGLAPPQCYPGPKWSPSDPMFFLHHAMVDKIWYDWQNRDPRNKNIFAGGSVSWAADSNVSYAQYPTGAPPSLGMSSVVPSDGLWGDVAVSDVLDTTGGKLCYIYA